MIIFRAQGGLGNQLFEYAAARRLALVHGVELAIDDQWYRPPPRGVTPRQLDIMQFNAKCRRATSLELAGTLNLKGRVGRFIQKLSPYTIIRERGNDFNSSALCAPPNTYMIGYWQSEKYCLDIRKQLLEELTPVQPSSMDDRYADAILRSDSVSIHVRRGDYVSLVSTANFHGACSLEYYVNVINYVKRHVFKPKVFVFSADIDWVRNHIIVDGDVEYIFSNTETPAARDLILMSWCRHNIIANSSYSWWGAWLGRPDDRIVVAPTGWFAGGPDAPNLAPERWVRVS